MSRKQELSDYVGQKPVRMGTPVVSVSNRCMPAGYQRDPTFNITTKPYDVRKVVRVGKNIKASERYTHHKGSRILYETDSPESIRWAIENWEV
ncbi:hypothetical protein ACFL3V_04620 [Nanoarchaeota archaeon]